MATSPEITHAEIVHASPTRTRIRLARSDRGKGGADRIRQVMEQQPGVTSVEVNHATGSILIHHRPEPASGRDLGAILDDVGVVLGGLVSSGDLGPGQHSEAASRVEEALGDLNRRFAVATGGRFDLKFLLPATFLSVGAWRVLTNPGSFLGEIPTYALLWYAFDSFHKLHLQAAPARRTLPEGKDQQAPGE